MEIEDILRSLPDKHVGYQLSSISKTSFDPEGICVKLKRVPSKITAFFFRDRIKSVYKSNHEKRDEDNYYIIRATDDTLFHVDY